MNFRQVYGEHCKELHTFHSFRISNNKPTRFFQGEDTSGSSLECMLPPIHNPHLTVAGGHNQSLSYCQSKFRTPNYRDIAIYYFLSLCDYASLFHFFQLFVRFAFLFLSRDRRLEFHS